MTTLKPVDGDGIGCKEAKAFAQAVCTAMARDSPERYLVNRRKDLRGGRIYLDYLCNDRLSTAVAVFSPRARPGAPGGMPLSWNQVRAGLDPLRFTIGTVPALAARSKAWKEYCEAERPLHAAVKKLVGSRQ